MSNCSCSCKCNCTLFSVVAAVILGVIAAFLQITGTITVTAAFLWVAVGIGVVYLAALLVSTALLRRAENGVCACSALDTALVGILGSILFGVILLAVGITATSVISAILVGILVFFLSLLFGATACLVRVYADC